nr:hypothetical protein GCM10020093_010990 [Planobispora longispora]
MRDPFRSAAARAEPPLGAADHVVVVQYRHVVAAGLAVAAEDVVPAELAEELRGRGGSLDQVGQEPGGLADVEHGVDVAAEDVQVVAGHGAAPVTSPSSRKFSFPMDSAYSRIAPQKLREASQETCLTVSMRKPSQSLSAIQYL